MSSSNSSAGARILRFLSGFLKSLWLFFPGILFLLLGVFFFWALGQGKDIIVAFTENRSRTIFLHLNYTRIVFFMAICFWVYVTWYFSRIISYIKKSKQEDRYQAISGQEREVAEQAYNERKNVFDIPKNFLDAFPRIMGNACFLVLELAVLQSPALAHPISSLLAWIIFFVMLLILWPLNKWIVNTQVQKSSFRTGFWVMFWIAIAALIVSSFFQKISILILLLLLLLFQVVYIFYINLRRQMVEEAGVRIKNKMDAQGVTKLHPTNPMERVMDYFCVPRKESGYFRSFLIVGLIGIVFYLLTINILSFARAIGPFPFIILAFGVLLAFDNIVTAFSVRFSVNFHFLLFILAFVLGFGETHYVRTITAPNQNNAYAARPTLNRYLTDWLQDRVAADSSGKEYPVYFVMANGGASRSGYWTAGVLGQIEDSSLVHSPNDRFSDHVFCLSGTSGGGVGVATFFSLLRDKEQRTKPGYDTAARAYLKRDYFTYTFARMMGPDFFNYIFHISTVEDRAAALERSFEETARKQNDSLYTVPFYDPLSTFPALKNDHVYLPILFVNTTRMQDGNPGVVTNLRLDSGLFNNRVDVLGLLKNDQDISMTSGAILGARFPYLSPAGRIGDNYFVDGGYFDNSGAGVVQEIIRGIINIGKQDSIDHGSAGRLYQQVRKLRFTVLHIVNSPVDLDSSNIKKVAPIKNDLMAPILTIVGAYDMQTTVNDGRLINFLKDIDHFSGNRANYIQISLYRDAAERNGEEADPSYAMNWFMSDTTLRRIDQRLQNQPKLKALIKSMQQQGDTTLLSRIAPGK